MSVTNSAPVSFANGADQLVYTVGGAGAVGGGGSGTLAALASANVYTPSIDASAPGGAAGDCH